AVKRLDVRLGQDVVVFGPGPIGLMMVQLAKATGAGRVALIGRRDYPLGAGKRVGADLIINTADEASEWYAPDAAARIREAFGHPAPRAIVATANMQALQSALDVTGNSSTVVYFGLPGPADKLEIPMLEAIQSNRTIKCSWLAPLVWDNVFAAIASGQVDLSPILTHRFALKDAEEGIRFMKNSREDKIKGVVLVGGE
ncbi:MAG: zinc-binding dehydrogenase, partial [Clostridia bacterium]|nr:zinc-binding dehydrogenase [Clostridia bacterium]